MNGARIASVAVLLGACAQFALPGAASAGPHDELIAKHSAHYGVPPSLIRRVIHIESKGNPRVISKGNFGLMQIRLGTAKSMGYRGTADGLLDADTNMTYAVKYLASAYRAAGCNEDRAISYYQRGFYKRARSKCAVPTVVAAAKVETTAAGLPQAGPPADVLRPRVVQIQTIVRPAHAAVAVPAPAVAASAPVAAAPVVVAKAEPAPAVPVVKTRPEVAAVPVSAAPVAVAAPVVAAAPVAAPAAVAAPVAAAIPAVVKDAEPAGTLLPMPKPRPAKAPKVVAMLDAAPPVSPSGAALPSERGAADGEKLASIDPGAVPLPRARPEIAATEEVRAGEPRQVRQRTHRTRRAEKPNAIVAFLQKITAPDKRSHRRRHR